MEGRLSDALEGFLIHLYGCGFFNMALAKIGYGTYVIYITYAV